MFSLEFFYKIISKNLLEPLEIENYYFDPFGSTNSDDLKKLFDKNKFYDNYTLFYDQEPIYSSAFEQLSFFHLHQPISSDSWFRYLAQARGQITFGQHDFYILANSEKSVEKRDIIKSYKLYDWYYFFHGFAALDWYRNIRYIPPIRSYSKLFISFNNLINGKRCYRLEFLSKLVSANLHNLGYISITQDNTEYKIKKELANSFSPLTTNTKKTIFYNVIPNISNFRVDQNPRGNLSADDNLEILSSGLFHVVTETVFYDQKLHLTEKIFKPIVAKRPFLLLAAPYNLQYLKSYGFKTFDRWLDESYDTELDHEKRIDMVVNELKKLSNLSSFDLDKIYLEMQEILDYNFNWFYTGFRQKITEELVDNFVIATKQYNLNKSKNADNYLDISVIDFETVKKRLILGSY
jgi:hypothetical protein